MNNSSEQKDPDLVDFLSDVNMQILHISKNMEDIRSSANWIEQLQSVSELVARYDYRALQDAIGQARQNLATSQDLVNRVKEIGASTVTLRKRFIRQFAAIIAISALFLIAISAYLGGMYLPGRPQFGAWSCEALGGHVQKQNNGPSFCYYVLD